MSVTTEDIDRRIVTLLRFGFMIDTLAENFTHLVGSHVDENIFAWEPTKSSNSPISSNYTTTVIKVSIRSVYILSLRAVTPGRVSERLRRPVSYVPRDGKTT